MRQERTVQASLFDGFADRDRPRVEGDVALGGVSIAICSAWWPAMWAGVGSRRPDGKVCLPRRCCDAPCSSNTTN